MEFKKIDGKLYRCYEVVNIDSEIVDLKEKEAKAKLDWEALENAKKL